MAKNIRCSTLAAFNFGNTYNCFIKTQNYFYKKENCASMRKGTTFEKIEKEIENNTITGVCTRLNQIQDVV